MGIYLITGVYIYIDINSYICRNIHMCKYMMQDKFEDTKWNSDAVNQRKTDETMVNKNDKKTNNDL